MNQDTGEIREFSSEVPDGWKELREGKVISFDGLNFVIYVVRVEDQEVVLKPISKKEALGYAAAEANKEAIRKLTSA